MSVISAISVIIACLEDPTFDVRINEGFIEYDSERYEFSLNRPIGDNWCLYIQYIPQPLPVLVRIEKRIIFILFAALNDAIALEKWGEFKHEVRQFEKSYDNQQAEQISLMV